MDAIPKDRLQQAIGTVLRERYLWHAELAAALAVMLWIIRFILLEIR